MQYQLPTNHGLKPFIIEDNDLLPKDGENISITNIQYAALEEGVARDTKILAVAPTSTGKTHIAMWALLSWLIEGSVENASAVYLVSHRALASQKFEEFQATLRDKHFGGDPSAIILATGDGVLDANGPTTANPLDAPLLVATYEKYLGLLSAAGLKNDMSSILVICDEIQLIADKSRGRNTEILLTILKNSRLGHFVGLSAVIERGDAEQLSSWLNLKLVYTTTREKHLHYQCRTPTKTLSINTSRLEEGVSHLPANPLRQSPDIAASLCENAANLPIVVFCMTIDKVYSLAQQFKLAMQYHSSTEQSLNESFSEDTDIARQLSDLLNFRVAVHTADLLEEERRLVELKLKSREVDVIFCTSTLAAGVNFPIKTAIFDDWKRWDGSSRSPIPNSEFQNMAGRAGRMGIADGEGQIIFSSEDNFRDIQNIKMYLSPDMSTAMIPQLNPETFDQLSLWLLSCGISSSVDEVRNFLLTTFTAYSEGDNNLAGLSHWEGLPTEVINKLGQYGFLINGSRIFVTDTGKQIAISGLLPDTANYLLDFVGKKGQELSTLIQNNTDPANRIRFDASILFACGASPEFSSLNRTRHFPYQLNNHHVTHSFTASIPHFLSEPSWIPYSSSIHASDLLLDWIAGAPMPDLEKRFNGVRAGKIQSMAREMAWCVSGFGEILAAATKPNVPPEQRPLVFRHLSESQLDCIRSIIPAMKFLTWRLRTGFPAETLWMSEFKGSNRISRREAVALLSAGIHSYTEIRRRTHWEDVINALIKAGINNANDSARKIQSGAHEWHRVLRDRTLNRLTSILPQHESLISQFFSARGILFQKKLEEFLTLAGIRFTLFDDGTAPGQFDYLIHIQGRPDFIIECKTKEANNLCELNEVRTVLAAAAQFGFHDRFCVTLCNPGVNPDTFTALDSCTRLAVCEVQDIAVALCQIISGNLSYIGFYDWLSQPGWARAETIFAYSQKYTPDS